MQKNHIIKRFGSDPVEMTQTLLDYAGLAAIIGDTGKHIGIKPNLVTPTPADFGATTHPEIIEGILIYLQSNGFHRISILEGSWVGDRTSDAYVYCGYQALCERYDVPFIDTQKDGFHEKDCAGMSLSICDCVDTVDFLIGVPVLKGHCQTRMTCALKNMKGLIPNSEKRKFHTMGLHKPIAHLSRGIPQDFLVVDHICGDPTFEEGGNPLQTDCVMAAIDPVLVDTYACHLLGLSVDDVPYVGMAAELGSGSTDLPYSIIEVLNEKGEPVRTFAGNEPDPYEARFMSRDRIWDVAVDIDDCESCSACFAALTAALIKLDEDKKTPAGGDDTISASEPVSHLPLIAIGQGHRGHTGEYGIGNCCRGFTHYIPGCPPREEDIYRELKKILR